MERERNVQKLGGLKMEESKKYELNLIDAKKIVKGTLIAAGGSALTYLLELLPMINWEGNEGIIIPIASVLINSILKLLHGNK